MLLSASSSGTRSGAAAAETSSSFSSGGDGSLTSLLFSSSSAIPPRSFLSLATPPSSPSSVVSSTHGGCGGQPTSKAGGLRFDWSDIPIMGGGAAEGEAASPVGGSNRQCTTANMMEQSPPTTTAPMDTSSSTTTASKTTSSPAAAVVPIRFDWSNILGSAAVTLTGSRHIPMDITNKLNGGSTGVHPLLSFGTGNTSSSHPLLPCSSSSSTSSPKKKTKLQHNDEEAVPMTLTASDEPKTGRGRQQKRRVRFASVVRVRTLGVELGDHPYCVQGMALSCSNDIVGEAFVAASDYGRQSHSNTISSFTRRRRPMAELRLDYAARRHRLELVTGRSALDLEMANMELQQQEQREQQQPHQGNHHRDNDDHRFASSSSSSSCKGRLRHVPSSLLAATTNTDTAAVALPTSGTNYSYQEPLQTIHSTTGAALAPRMMRVSFL